MNDDLDDDVIESEGHNNCDEHISPADIVSGGHGLYVTGVSNTSSQMEVSTMMEHLQHKISDKSESPIMDNIGSHGTRSNAGKEDSYIGERMSSINLEEIPVGHNVSFLGRQEDERNAQASKFQDELQREHIYPGTIYKSDTWGGFDDYTTTKIKNAIIDARSANRISDRTYQELMSNLKKASHYA